LFYRSFDQLFTVLSYFINHVRRNVCNFVVFWQTRVIPYESFLLKYVNNTNEVVFDTDWQSHYQWVRAQYGFNLLNNAVEIGTHTIQFVNEDNTSYF
jgi:hypothetical protein